MSITVDYKAISPEDFEQLKDDYQVMQLFFEDEPPFSLEKSWHVIHYLLTDDAGLDDEAFTDPPLGSVVMGGTPTQFECTYGMVRYLKPDEVALVAEALGEISLEALTAKCSAESFNDAGIYPLGRGGDWDEEEVEAEIQFLRVLYPSLVDFFQKSAADSNVVLIACM